MTPRAPVADDAVLREILGALDMPARGVPRQPRAPRAQAHAIIPHGAAHTVSLFRLFLADVDIDRNHGGDIGSGRAA